MALNTIDKSDVGKRASPGTLLIVTQVYVPDPASLGQHMHDAASEMARRGWRVIVYTARHSYEDASVCYNRREKRDGVEIRRLPLSSFGKGSLVTRLVGGMSLLAQTTTRALGIRGLSGVLVSTSPPMAPLTALVLRALRRVPFVFWVMDINPDQMIALGRVSQQSMSVRLFEVLVRRALDRARHVITLDRYMEQRLHAKAPLEGRISVTPPWPLEDHLEPVPHDANPFRRAHDLEDKFVLMYSGNLSPSHPLTTILEAARRLRGEPNVVFMFIGGGLARPVIEAFIEREGLDTVRLLPYQPLEQLRLSLSAADVHLIAMGEAMVGIVHPCKLYGAMAVARPVLLLGPRQSHAGQIIQEHGIGWQVDHGDVDGAEAAIGEAWKLSRNNPVKLAAMGAKARQAIATHFSKTALCAAVCDAIEAHAANRRTGE